MDGQSAEVQETDRTDMIQKRVLSASRPEPNTTKRIDTELQKQDRHDETHAETEREASDRKLTHPVIGTMTQGNTEVSTEAGAPVIIPESTTCRDDTDGHTQ